MKLISRTIQSAVEETLFQGKVIIVYGARQVGKTTLIQQIQKKYSDNALYLNCDEPDIRESLTDKTSTELKSLLGNSRLILIDEAQRVKNIGLTLKLLVDNFPEIQVIATGSSSFDLSNDIAEPLTGRKREFHLFPFSLAELKEIYSAREIDRLLEQRIVYGMYPEVVKNESEAEKQLKEISRSYLYKDILRFQQVKNPEVLRKLLQALALQIGNEVSFNELANLAGINRKTVMRYIELLEKAFIIFRLPPYSRNLRKEISKLRKIYFYDTGVRNVLINNLNPLQIRQDVEALWENFLISERIKSNCNLGRDVSNYFWRTHQKAEMDYLELFEGRIYGYELKWQGQAWKPPKSFIETYPKAKTFLVNKTNYHDFLRLNF